MKVSTNVKSGANIPICDCNNPHSWSRNTVVVQLGG